MIISIYLNLRLMVIKKHTTSHFKIQLFYLIDFAARPREGSRGREKEQGARQWKETSFHEGLEAARALLECNC